MAQNSKQQKLHLHLAFLDQPIEGFQKMQGERNHCSRGTKVTKVVKRKGWSVTKKELEQNLTKLFDLMNLPFQVPSRVTSWMFVEQKQLGHRRDFARFQ